MENTLDSIRPSESLEEMSYLFGRDPSILAYNQRPIPSKNTKKKLLSLYEVEENSATKVSENSDNVSENSQHIQTMKVYLRLKPFPKKLKLTEEQQTAYEIVNSTTLVTKLPILDTSSVKQPKSTENICKKFIFSQTFGPETTQLELFEQTVQQQMVDFLAGHNCTIMTYGTTNSGKSYTLQGTNTSPGLIPRALEFIFSNITVKPNPLYKPLHYNDVISLSALDRAQELEAKTKLLTFSSVDKHQYMNSYKEMQKLLHEELVRPSECHDAHYSIWVSFAEIYNEIVYDLLSNECQKKRMPLKLGSDSSGRAFIRGLKNVYVNSAAEAYQVLMAGQYNLKVAATALNAKSSRSHCIFTIILLKYYAEHQPETVEVSTFSFCDLAGSERLKKTLNVGDRLKEAQNINTSLLVLGRCLKSIHEGQLTRTKPDAVGPFRESKLTRLFQRALSGREHLALIVNVNPLPNLYIETQNVLNFAAIAKKIVIEKKKEIQKKKAKSRFSQIVMQSMQTVTDWDSLEVENVDSQQADIPEETTSDYLTSEEYMDVVKENEKLKKEIVMLKNSALLRDFQSRQEMAEQYIAKINELEVDWKKRINDVEAQHEDDLDWTVKQLEEFYEKKLNQLRKRKRPRNDDDDNEEDNNGHDSTIAELSEQNTKLQDKNELLKKSLTEIKVTNETLIVEKNKISFQLGLLKEDLKVTKSLLKVALEDIHLNDDGKAFIEEMKSQLSIKDEQIKNLKIVLNEAKDEYITITSDLRKKELCIDEQAKTIIEQEEKIEDLELDLEQVNVCLAEKSRIVEILDEKVEHQNEKLSDYENKMIQLQEEINQLKNERSVLRSSKTSTSKTFVQDEYEEIFIKEELIVGDTSDNLNNVTKTMQKESKIDKTDLINFTFPLETSSKQISESMDISQQNIEHGKQTFVEIGCQVDVNNDGVENKESAREEAAVQTDELSNDDVTKMEELTARYNDIQAQYERDRAKVKELTEKLRDTEKTVQLLNEENQSNKTAVDEYKHSVQVLEQQLSLAAEDKQKAEEALSSSNTVFEQRIANYEREIVELKRDLSTARSNVQQSLDKFESMQEEFNNYILKRKEETNIHKPDDRIAADDVKHLDELKEKMLELEKSAETIAKLERHIDELNGNLKTCEMEKKCIKETLEKNEKRLSELENRLAVTVSKEQEKDVEISTLQRELKQSIQRYESAAKADDKMEAELKTIMSELTQTKEKLFQREQDVKELNIRLENYEKNAKFINLFEETAKERQIENERLRNLNEELKTNLMHKECEMNAFMKNRDETVTKYEALVKNQQEDLDRQKREVKRYQELFCRQLTPTPDTYKKLQDQVEFLQERLQKYETGDNAKAKDYYDVTSEDDSSIKSQRTKSRRGKKTASRLKREDDVPVVELSESESKRNTRRAALPLPESSNDSKRTTRRRKLFVDDSLVDIEPVETNTTRTLRNRKK
ncbi:kinesin-like protein KIF20A [Pseudomyrmex gracilis]|uniref:kinesin-like protein KIF20A n=1 Tax=Pseudomyrmex gracilis TaxID=219809 RepID=UPI000995D9BA|nr:kinesin-like protein KIF20A [Pseudomyrmex gracilis]